MQCLLLASMLLMAAPQDDPALLVPADSMLYFGTNSVRLGSEAAKNSAMRKILEEPDVHAFLAEPMRAFGFAIEQLAEGGADAIGGLPEGMQPEDGGSWEDALLGGEGGLPLGRAFVALTHVTLPEFDSIRTLVSAAEVGLVLGVELLDDEDVATLRSAWNWIPFPSEEGQHNGQAYFVKRLPTDELEAALYLTFVGNLAIVSLSETSLHQVLDRSNPAGGAMGSLGGSPEYRRMISLAGGNHPGGSTSFLRAGPLFQLCWQGLALALTTEGKTELLAKLDGLRGELGMGALQWSGSTSHRDLSGLVHTVKVTSVDTSRPGLMARCLGSPGAFNRDLLQGAPGDAMSVSGTHVTGLADVYDFAMHAFETLAPDEAAEFKAQLAGVMGDFSLRDDVLGNVTGSMLHFQLSGQGVMGQPASILRVGLRNPDRFVGVLNRLLPFAGDALGKMIGASAPLELTESTHGAARFFELDLSRTPLAMTMIQPAFAIVDDDLVLGMESAEFLKTYLNGEAGSGSITEDATFMAFADGLATKGQVTALGYTDWAKVFGSAYGQLAGAAQMMAGGLGDIPVDLALMPPEDAVARHLGSMYVGEYVSHDGNLRVYRSQGQFELMDFMPLLVPVAALALAGQAGLDTTPEPEVDLGEQARAHVAELQAALTIYKITEGGYPDSLDDLVRPLRDFENGCLGRPELPVDPWGSSYRYRVEGRKAVVWSVGPNGQDEGGEGDDVTKRKRSRG